MSEARNIYLHDIPMDEAWAHFTGAIRAAGDWEPLPGEDIPVQDALGRVTAEPVWAQISAPHYHASAMDGYAVRAADTADASADAPGGTGAPVKLPIQGTIAAEYSFGKKVVGELVITAFRYVGQWEEFARFTTDIDGHAPFEIPAALAIWATEVWE